jgi:colicin import membrane protein
MMWKRRTTVGTLELPEERKALAERYTIDAEEAHRREQLPAAVAAREAEERARRAARAELERKAAEEQARRAAEEDARRAAG